jgi:predicted RNase H-like nuclease (RuvC/YqgF family)
MKTPIHIEAHYELRRKIIHSAPDEGAQLIADSEARATRKQIEALEITTRRWLNVEKERDQLRAEVERACEVEHELRAEVKRMTRYYEYDHKCLCEVQDRCHLWKQRAMKAEADLAAAKERLRSEAMDDYASIKDLQRELATEREKAERYRLVTLRQDADLATERARLDAGTILLTVAGERVWHCGVDLRAAIDAAMKEGAK